MGKKQSKNNYVPTYNYTYYVNKYAGPTVPSSIENKIKQFKSEGEYKFFNEFKYLNILNDLNSEMKKYQGNNIIKTTRNTFIKYLIKNLIEITEKKAKKEENYSSSLQAIRQLENLTSKYSDLIKNNDENYSKIEKIKQFCKFNLNCNPNVIDSQPKNTEDYKKEIFHYQNLVYFSGNEMEQKIYSLKLLNAQAEYIKHIALQYSKMLKLNDKIIVCECEKTIKEYKYNSKLKDLLHEVKILYGMALENIIEEKINKKENCDEELNKYKYLTDTENIQNKLKEFNIQNEINKKNVKTNEKDSRPNFEKKFDYKEISIETIEHYLEKIQSLDKYVINKEIKQDIISQVQIYQRIKK